MVPVQQATQQWQRWMDRAVYAFGLSNSSAWQSTEESVSSHPSLLSGGWIASGHWAGSLDLSIARNFTQGVTGCLDWYKRMVRWRWMERIHVYQVARHRLGVGKPIQLQLGWVWSRGALNFQCGQPEYRRKSVFAIYHECFAVLGYIHAAPWAAL